MPDAIRGELVSPGPNYYDQARLAAASFLAGYTGKTLEGYGTDLAIWSAWCAEHGIAVLEAKRAHIELFARAQEQAGKAKATVARRLTAIAGFYRYCDIEAIIDKDPAAHVRRPKVSMDSTTLGLDRMELGAFIAAAAASTPTDHALACLLGLNGLRVSEACNADVTDLGTERGHRVLHIIGKGDKPALVPLAPRTGRAILMAAGERTEGPLLVNCWGNRLDRHGAARIVRRLAKQAGITKRISPHSLRHSFITAALDASVPLRDVQIAARHADPRTTTRYDRARNNLDRHCAYVVAAFVAGAG